MEGKREREREIIELNLFLFNLFYFTTITNYAECLFSLGH